MSHETLVKILAVSGVTFQLVGFAAAVLLAYAARYSEYGDAGILRRSWHRFLSLLVYWFEPPPEPVVADASLHASTSISVSASAEVAPKSEIERLERELHRLSGSFDQHRQETMRRLGELQAGLRQHADESTRQLQEFRDRYDHHRRRDMRREKRASLLFFTGTLLTVLSYVV